MQLGQIERIWLGDDSFSGYPVLSEFSQKPDVPDQGLNSKVEDEAPGSATLAGDRSFTSTTILPSETDAYETPVTN